MSGAPDGIVMRIHRVNAECVVAACDAELLGQSLAVGPNGHTVLVTAQFYGEERVTREELVRALHRATIANLLGSRVVRIAVEGGFIAEGAHGLLGDVPHTEIFSMLP